MITLLSNTTDPKDLPWVCEQLREADMAGHATDNDICRAIDNSLCFWVHMVEDTKFRPIGFARVVTDHWVISTLADVIIAKEFRGQGLGRKLMEAVIAHPSVARTVCVLASRDAKDFYPRFGFEPCEVPVLIRMPHE